MKKIFFQPEAMAIEDKCEALYSEGIQSIINYCNLLNLEYSYCQGCENDYPHVECEDWSACCVCGTTKDKHSDNIYLVK